MWFSETVANSTQFFSLVPWVVFFPLIGLLVNLIFGGRMSEKAIGITACGAAGLSLLISVLQAVSLLGHPGGMVVYLADWIVVGDLAIQWAFQVDTLSVTMMLVVAGVGTLIHIYAVGYMHEDVRHNGDPTRYQRFFVFFNLFIVAMMILVSADNYLMLFVGWEGVGLCSYLLIGFWYDKGKDGIGNALAGKKAFITNRIGDFGFLIAAFMIYVAFRTFNFHQIFEQIQQAGSSFTPAIFAITLFMLLGVAGKSAQIPLYVWLPDAMAGPTPVSALIHAATMVTAGVYLIARSHPLYVQVPEAQNIVALVGGATALFAATIAVGQFDIKKVLAYSTISQLGFMTAAVGMGAFTAGMFHLVTHSFFKALLFLSAGSVIQGIEAGLHHIEHDPRLKKKMVKPHDFDPQDMRNMGGLRKRMPITFWVYLIGALALAGIAPLAGFWSKDEILAEAKLISPTVYGLLTIAAFFTAFYMGRQILMVFFGESRAEPTAHARENPPVITIPLMILAGLSLLGGFINLPVIHTFTHWLEHTLTIEEAMINFRLGEAAEASGQFNPMVAGISTGLALFAILLAWWIYMQRYPAMLKLPPKQRSDDPLKTFIGPLFSALENKWWVDELYQTLVITPYNLLARYLAQVIDGRFWHDWVHDVLIVGGFRFFTRLLSIQFDLGVIDSTANSLADLAKSLAQQMRQLQTGYVRSYALWVFLGVVVILGYLIFW
ncbi:MAG: NADH-quinone oxidoreductase subunit L [Anaerolineales bacterium]|nr:NADH-quinone oxidoreductase subunit L [Anaerolineales bacterium]